MTQKGALARHRIHQHLDLGFPEQRERTVCCLNRSACGSPSWKPELIKIEIDRNPNLSGLKPSSSQCPVGSCLAQDMEFPSSQVTGWGRPEGCRCRGRSRRPRIFTAAQTFLQVTHSTHIKHCLHEPCCIQKSRVGADYTRNHCG